MRAKVFGAIVGGCLMTAAPVLAQSNAQARADARAEAIARQQRYEISTLERVFEGAVEHGISVVRDRLQAVVQMPAELLISDNAHARGFRLEGYGVFFDVTVPIFDATLWTLRTLDQNDLGLDSAMKELQQIVKGNINAGTKVQLSASARLEGDLQTQRLEVAEGAVLIGRCVVGVNNQAAKGGDKVVTRPVESVIPPQQKPRTDIPGNQNQPVAVKK